MTSVIEGQVSTQKLDQEKYVSDSNNVNLKKHYPKMMLFNGKWP